MKKISIIIPTLNEEENIGHIIERINIALYYHDIVYEIIVVDDNSIDTTKAVAKHFARRFPVRFKLKKGKPGKAQSLIEGFSYAKYDLLCMIDADLQYPPEALPEMIQKIESGADIVVANREKKETNTIRKIVSKGYRYIFGKLLHNFDCDVQSGMKVFKKEIIQRITLNPKPWTFDLEFLLKSRNAGYKIETCDITFSKRTAGKSKIKLFTSIFQIGLAALKYKFQKAEVIPFHFLTEKKKGKGFHYKGQEYIHYSNLQHDKTAFFRLTRTHKIILLELFTIIIMALIFDWHATIVVTLAILTSLYFLDLLFNLYLVYRSFSAPSEIAITEEEIMKNSRTDWPSYTIFCPLYKEWSVVPQFAKAISQLDYPKDKLQVMFLLEEDDKETIRHIKQQNLPEYFEIVVVPNSQPKTKPKACNYGLLKATGEYVVIYDAEDIPDPLQLKKAVLAFQKGGKEIMCIQAKLNFYNPHQNILSRMFTAEYSLWFDLVLTGLQSINAPIPLGGTSNHFRTANLIKLNGWDSFNVTEDCDLGMRLVKAGYRTAIVDSITLEEANSSYRNWIKQRSRWIKGYMQTYFVHCRDLSSFSKHKFNIPALSFQLIVGGKVLSMFINPLMWITTIAYFLFRAHIGTFIESFFPTWVLYMGVFSLIFGNFLYIYYYMIGCAKHGHDELVKYVILVPFYWLFMSLAASYAVYKLITAPHHWAKTKHGLHLHPEETIQDAYEFIKNNNIWGRVKHSFPARISYPISGISIVLPAYNEEENIIPMIDKVNTFMKTLPTPFEIIIVNDGSRDNTKEIVNRLVEQNSTVRGIHHPTNYGYGVALRTGFKAAKKDWIFFTDSDMQFDISEITKLMKKAPEAEIIVGYRKNRQDPFFRILNANLYKLSLRLLFGLNIKDIDCAFKIFSKEIIIRNPLYANGALINAELLIKAKRANYRIIQVGVTHYPRVKGSPTGAKLSVILRAMKELITFRIAGTI